MTGAGIHAALLPDGRRLHLQHGPIDLVIEAFGDPAEVCAAYEQASAAFADVLAMLVRELPLLRTALGTSSLVTPHRRATARPSTNARPTGAPFQEPLDAAVLRHDDGLETMPIATGPVARRMIAACWPFRDEFVTPMAAVAGAVADHILQEMTAGHRLERAYVNDGGDIAFHLAPGQQLSCGLVADLAAPAIDGTIALTHDMPVRGIATSGRARKGQGGRSFSFGIADAVTVLAHDGAAADVAATLIANAVDLPDHPAIRRGPASEIDPDSDLGERPVTLDLGALTDAEVRAALRAGAARAEILRRSGHIHGAVLVLRGRFATVGTGLPGLQAA